MKTYELLGYAVLKRILLDLYEGYIAYHDVFGDEILDINRWKARSRYSIKQKKVLMRYIFTTKEQTKVIMKLENSAGYIFADALFFIYSDDLSLFTIWSPEQIISYVKRMKDQSGGTYIPFSITYEEIVGYDRLPAYSRGYPKGKFRSKRYFT